MRYIEPAVAFEDRGKPLKNRRAADTSWFLAGILVLAFANGAQASDGDYLYIDDDLGLLPFLLLGCGS